MAKAIGDLVAEAEAEADANLELRQSWNVAPTTDVPIVLERLLDGEVHREVHVARWGLVPGWAKDLSVGVRAFNARSETVESKPTFRAAIKKRRAAVPVQGYYEWKKIGGKKQPYFVHHPQGKLIFFAGLYEWWKDADDTWILSTTILTMDSPPAQDPGILGELAGLHDRLPIPMGRDMMRAWLDPERQEETTVLLERLRAQAFDEASQWAMHEVDSAVGNVRNNSAELIEPHSSALF